MRTLASEETRSAKSNRIFQGGRYGNGLVLKQSLFFSGSNHFKEKFCASECLLRLACHANLFKTHHTLDMNTTTDKERREFGLRR